MDWKTTESSQPWCRLRLQKEKNLQKRHTWDLKSLLGPALFPKMPSNPRTSRHSPGTGLDSQRRFDFEHRGNCLREEGRMKLTGQLGEVMQESSKLPMAGPVHPKPTKGPSHWFGSTRAFTCPGGCNTQRRSFSRNLHGNSNPFLALKKTVKKDLAMTGELTLTAKCFLSGEFEKNCWCKIGGKKIILPRATNRSTRNFRII